MSVCVCVFKSEHVFKSESLELENEISDLSHTAHDVNYSFLLVYHYLIQSAFDPSILVIINQSINQSILSSYVSQRLLDIRHRYSPTDC